VENRLGGVRVEGVGEPLLNLFAGIPAAVREAGVAADGSGLPLVLGEPDAHLDDAAAVVDVPTDPGPAVVVHVGGFHRVRVAGAPDSVCVSFARIGRWGRGEFPADRGVRVIGVPGVGRRFGRVLAVDDDGLGLGFAKYFCWLKKLDAG
jgi:hypothetical protein